MIQYQVIDPPDSDWLTRLRRNHTAYDPKQNRFVRIEWAWEPLILEVARDELVSALYGRNEALGTSESPNMDGA